MSTTGVGTEEDGADRTGSADGERTTVEGAVLGRGSHQAPESGTLPGGRAGPGTAEAEAATPELVIITGMSGAGRSTAAKFLEDLGWFVVDNLPPALLPTMVELGSRTHGAVPRIAVVVDARGGSFFDHLLSALAELDARGLRRRTIFLEASDEALVRRFEGVRRPHPLQGERGRITDGIARERELLRDLRGEADLVLDTSALNVHELRAKMELAFAGTVAQQLKLTVMSFGFKYGLPVDADLVVDCRFLPNPHWVPELRPRTGLDPQVSDYVLSQHGAKEFLDRYVELTRIVFAGYRQEGKRYVTLAVGCTGGKHRSVAMAEQLAARLTDEGADATVIHRDIGRE